MDLWSRTYISILNLNAKLNHGKKEEYRRKGIKEPFFSIFYTVKH
jgi:hypothetical protein